MTMGIMVRSSFGGWGLFAGTAILGLGIAVGNVLLPGLVKKDFPSHIGIMTGTYTLSMNIFAAAASGISLPLAMNLGLGWSGSLQVWAVLGFIAILFWLQRFSRKNSTDAGRTAADKGASDKKAAPQKMQISIWRAPLAWQVSFYMGLQSMVFYCMIAWLPNILVQQGMSNISAGWLLSLMQLAIIPMTFTGALLAGRSLNQIWLVIAGSFFVIIGLSGILLADGRGFTWLWIIFLGIGGGITFGLAMMFFSLRARNVETAAELSGMAQSVGYLLAAFGPLIFGYLRDIANSWELPLIFLLAAAVLTLLSGLSAGRNRFVD